MIPLYKPTIVRKDLEYVLNCLITERIEEGALTREFEKSLCHFFSMKYSLAANSFSSALHLALLALDIRPDDEILLSAYAPAWYLDALSSVQARPVPVDIDMAAYGMDANLAAQKITVRTKAVLLTHPFGLPADIDEILKLNIPVIEDCSTAFGAEYTSAVLPETKLAGTFGHLSLFSFDTDTVITTGNGGMILSNSRDPLLNARRFKLNPFADGETWQRRYDYRISDISSALGLSQLKIVRKLIERRCEIANYYNERFKRSKFKTVIVPENKKSVWTKYTLLLEGNLDKAIKFLRQSRIDADRPVRSPLFRVTDPEGKEYPNAFRCFTKLLEIPAYPALKKKEIEKIAGTILRVL